MTANYFMLTKDSIDMGGVALRSTGAQSVYERPIANPSFTTNLNGWSTFMLDYDEPSPVDGRPTLTRITSDFHTAPACAQLTNTDDAVDGLYLANLSNHADVLPGETATFSAYVKGQQTTNREVMIFVDFYDAEDGNVDTIGSVPVASTGGWQQVSVTDVVPTGAVRAAVNPVYRTTGGAGLAVGEWARFDGIDVPGGPGSLPSPTVASTYAVPATKEGLISVLDATAANGARRRIPVSGFNGSTFRAVRNPGTPDDSGNTISKQTYDHGWRLAPDLPSSWPAPSGIEVVPIVGTPDVDDGQGVYGFTTRTRAAGGSGTVRQILSGGGGQIVNILDALANASPATRAGLAAGGIAGMSDLYAAAASNLPFWHRASLGARAALAIFGYPDAVPPAMPTGRYYALWNGIYAFTAKEHGLIGSTFTTSHYNAMTGPIRASFPLPSGY